MTATDLQRQIKIAEPPTSRKILSLHGIITLLRCAPARGFGVISMPKISLLLCARQTIRRL
jgi:hypothetical protein